MIWHGSGSSHSPNVPHIDRLLGERWQARGFTLPRVGVTFATTQKKQAEDYAVKGLYLIEPEPKTAIAWIPGVADVVLDFEWFLKDHDWDTPTLSDTQGDISIADIYAQDNNRDIIKVIDAFLDSCDLMEMPFQEAQSLLHTHKGEVWLTGSHRRHLC